MRSLLRSHYARPHTEFLTVPALAKLRDRDGVTRKRFLYVAIDRATRFVHLAVKNDETSASAIAFLTEALSTLPFKVIHVLTDRGSCFTSDAFKDACHRHRVEHRTTRPYTPRTDGMVERFNGRVQREVLGITICSHRDLKTVLNCLNLAYNARRQRVLESRSPNVVLQERLAANPEMGNAGFKPPDPRILPKALQVIADAKEVSQPDS